MAAFCAILTILTTILVCDLALGQSDSLRSALNAIDRRQRDLSDYEDEYGYSVERPEDLAFLNNPSDRAYDKGELMGRPLLDYLDDDVYDPINKRITSPFRERLEEDKQKQMEEFTKNLVANLENSGMPVNADENYLKEIWERYYGNDINDYDRRSGINKRYYYPSYGIENIGLRKRGRFLDNDEEPLYTVHHHVPRDDDSDYQMNYIKNRHFQHGGAYNYPNHIVYPSKRFAVAKRSSAYAVDQKSPAKKQTDPKVEKDLSNIFGYDQIEQSADKNNASGNAKPSKTKKAENKSVKKTEKKDTGGSKKSEINMEVFAPVAPQNKKPLHLKKKSIDWSDYFGLDRRKKSDKGLDKEWLLERYHKAVAVTAKKRNAELPLQSFRNNETPAIKKEANKQGHSNDVQKVEEMDSKLKNLEDEIVDDALKYTGAHQDDTDSKEIQQVKDNIISRLAQAYSIEKMRNALEEYKNAIENEKARLKQEGKLFNDYTFEEKRLSVPRKDAIDESRENPDADNNIKCTSSEDCHEQNYKTPSEILDNHFANIDQCPAIQRACNDVASIIGHYGHVFEAACNIHQMCLLCSNNSWFSPTRQCNALFLAKANDLCKGNEECRKEAHRSVRYLLDINRSLQAQSALNDECELQCPDTENPSLSQ